MRLSQNVYFQRMKTRDPVTEQPVDKDRTDICVWLNNIYTHNVVTFLPSTLTAGTINPVCDVDCDGQEVITVKST